MPQRPRQPHHPCIVCGLIRGEPLHLEERVALCRPCAHRLGTFMGTATTTFLRRLWDLDLPNARTLRFATPWPGTGHLERQMALEQFNEGVRTTLQPTDFTTHFDLAMPYNDMGLAADAIVELSVLFDERAPQQLAQRAFEFMFAPERARADALRLVVAALGAS